MQKISFDSVESIIREVAESEILPRFRHLKEGDVAFKIGDDPVTIADKEAEKALSARLTALLPGSKVLGEEAFAANRGLLELFSGESPVWIIDPIDGTKAFVAGKPLFGVIVALAQQNHTIAGWLYDPTSKEFVTAEKGGGAYHKGQKLRVLTAETPSKLVGTAGSRPQAAYDGLSTAQKQGQPCLENPWSFACHEYARLTVAAPHFAHSGPQWHFRGTLSYFTPWDDAAGALIHQEAGGYSAHWNGDPIRPSSYRRGMMLAPDRDNWLALRDWIRSFCPALEDEIARVT